MARPRVVFVAGFTPMPGGEWGGQLSIANMLIRSPLSQVIELAPICSTSRSVPPPRMPIRIWDAIRRIARFIGKLPWCVCALIFTTDGLGLVEKTLMACMARLAGKGVVIRFGSGHLPSQCARYPIVAACLRIALLSAHVVCTQGPFWKRFFGRYREARGKVIEIGNAVELRPLPGGRAASRGRRIVFVGWMQRHKGIFDALAAFLIILRRYRDATFTFVGGGGDLEELRDSAAQAGALDNVRIVGWVSRETVGQILSESDIFLFPSHYEGLPNAVLEAMAAALPVVATPVGSVSDVIDHETGILVPVGDIGAIARAVEQLLSEPEHAARLGARARQMIELKYDVSKIWPLYVEAIERATACKIGICAARQMGAPRSGTFGASYGRGCAERT